jgi:hypothetical protein
MNRYVVTFSDGSNELVWAENKRSARGQMAMYAKCKGVKIVSVD